MKVAIDPSLIYGRRPTLAVGMRLVTMLANETIIVIKAAEEGQMTVADAVLVISMNRGTAIAVELEENYLEKVHELGAGIKALVKTSPIDVKKLRLGDRLVGIEGLAYTVVETPFEEEPFRGERVGAITVRREQGGLFTKIEIHFDELQEWGLLE